MVTRHGKNMTLAEMVDGILSRQESEAKELEMRKREKEEIEKKRKEYYEAHMKEETERLNKLVDWYKFKLDEIREAPVDSRPRKLEKLYQSSEKNKHLGVKITGTLNLVNYLIQAILLNWNYMNMRMGLQDPGWLCNPIMRRMSFTML